MVVDVLLILGNSEEIQGNFNIYFNNVRESTSDKVDVILKELNRLTENRYQLRGFEEIKLGFKSIFESKYGSDKSYQLIPMKDLELDKPKISELEQMIQNHNTYLN